MSSACPWGRTPGQPGEYVGEYKGMTDANHGDIREICRFPQPIYAGNIKGAKRSETENTRFRAA